MGCAVEWIITRRCFWLQIDKAPLINCDSVINLSLGVPRMSCVTAAILDWFSTPLLLLLQSAEPTQTTINNRRCQRRSYKNRSWCSISGTVCKLEWSSRSRDCKRQQHYRYINIIDAISSPSRGRLTDRRRIPARIHRITVRPSIVC